MLWKRWSVDACEMMGLRLGVHEGVVRWCMVTVCMCVCVCVCVCDGNRVACIECECERRVCMCVVREQFLGYPFCAPNKRSQSQWFPSSMRILLGFCGQTNAKRRKSMLDVLNSSKRAKNAWLSFFGGLFYGKLQKSSSKNMDRGRRLFDPCLHFWHSKKHVERVTWIFRTRVKVPPAQEWTWLAELGASPSIGECSLLGPVRSLEHRLCSCPTQILKNSLKEPDFGLGNSKQQTRIVVTVASW
jgi:hypothetical protein